MFKLGEMVKLTFQAELLLLLGMAYFKPWVLYGSILHHPSWDLVGNTGSKQFSFLLPEDTHRVIFIYFLNQNHPSTHPIHHQAVTFSNPKFREVSRDENQANLWTLINIHPNTKTHQITCSGAESLFQGKPLI